MKPAARTRVWRKTRRAVLKASGRGRRVTHRALIEAPGRSSTWLRRHPGEVEYWVAHAGTGRLIADLKTQMASAVAPAEANPQHH